MFILKYINPDSEETNVQNSEVNVDESTTGIIDEQPEATFNTDDSVPYLVDFKRISKNVVEITGDFPIQTDGFVLSRENRNDNWDYSQFTTVYKEVENGVQFSNDESVYVQPEIEQLTAEELEALFTLSKEAKIEESKRLLQIYLETHPLVSNCHGGVEAKYNVTSEKQALMVSNYLTYNIKKQAGIENVVLTWNASGEECEEWTEEEYTILILQISEYVKPLVSKQQYYEAQIRTCINQEELDSISINYSETESSESEEVMENDE